MRTDRLLSLIALLKLRGRLTAAQIAVELDVSQRTVLRDLDALSVAGIPVYAERGRHGGFALLPGFRADVSGLSADEATALLAGGGRLGTPEFAAALRKIAVALPDRQREQALSAARRILVRPEGFLRESTPMSVLGPMQQAVFDGFRVRLQYRYFDGEPTPRTLDPIGLIAADSNWYLVAGPRGSEPRTYRVSRCSDVVILGEPADRDDDVDLEALWARSKQSFRDRIEGLTVVVDADVAVLGQLGRTAEVDPAEPSTEGRSRATVQFADQRHAANVLWRFADLLTVVAPQEVRDAIAERVRAAADRWDSCGHKGVANP